MQKIERFIERLPVDTSQIVMRAGNTRQEETICGKYSFPVDDVTEFIDAVFDDLPEDNTKFRLIALDDKGRQHKAITIIPPQQATQGSELQIMVQGFLSMVQENRRVMSVLAGVIEDREETLEYVLHNLIQTKEDQIESDLAIGTLEMEKSLLQEAQESSVKEKALNLAENALAKMMTPPQITSESLKQLVKQNPSIIDEIMKDEELVSLIGDRLLK